MDESRIARKRTRRQTVDALLSHYAELGCWRHRDVVIYLANGCGPSDIMTFTGMSTHDLQSIVHAIAYTLRWELL
jgi:hypothetical protein